MMVETTSTILLVVVIVMVLPVLVVIMIRVVLVMQMVVAAVMARVVSVLLNALPHVPRLRRADGHSERQPTDVRGDAHLCKGHLGLGVEKEPPELRRLYRLPWSTRLKAKASMLRAATAAAAAAAAAPGRIRVLPCRLERSFGAVKSQGVGTLHCVRRSQRIKEFLAIYFSVAIAVQGIVEVRQLVARQRDIEPGQKLDELPSLQLLVPGSVHFVEEQHDAVRARNELRKRLQGDRLKWVDFQVALEAPMPQLAPLLSGDERLDHLGPHRSQKIDVATHL